MPWGTVCGGFLGVSVCCLWDRFRWVWGCECVGSLGGLVCV